MKGDKETDCSIIWQMHAPAWNVFSRCDIAVLNEIAGTAQSVRTEGYSQYGDILTNKNISYDNQLLQQLVPLYVARLHPHLPDLLCPLCRYMRIMCFLPWQVEIVAMRKKTHKHPFDLGAKSRSTRSRLICSSYKVPWIKIAWNKSKQSG